MPAYVRVLKSISLILIMLALCFVILSLLSYWSQPPSVICTPIMLPYSATIQPPSSHHQYLILLCASPIESPCHMPQACVAPLFSYSVICFSSGLRGPPHSVTQSPASQACICLIQLSPMFPTLLLLLFSRHASPFYAS